MRATLKKINVGFLAATLLAASGANAQSDGKIAFINRLDDATKFIVMDADGGNRTEVHSMDHTLTNAFGVGMSFSPDGRWIAGRQKVGFSGWDVIAVDVQSGDVVTLTDGSSTFFQPSWSPDGSRIAYVGFIGINNGVFVMDADGSDPVQLSDGKMDLSPAWSPDGSRIAFTSERDGNVAQIYVMDADGGNITRLTHRDADDFDPVWSPDGQRIAFWSIPQNKGLLDTEVFVMDADGGNVVQMTDRDGFDASPTWSPDGTHLLYASSMGRGVTLFTFMDLYVMDLAGGDAVNLTEGLPGGALNPSWVLPGEVPSLVQSVSWGEVKRLSR